jgi:hypothetical protein
MRIFAIDGNKIPATGVHVNTRQTTRWRPQSARVLAAAIAMSSLLGGGAIAGGDHMVTGNNPLAGKVRAANERFADAAQAVAEGYAPIPCVSGVEGGAMGIHYVNQVLIDDAKIDIGHPEAVMYEPGPDGSMALIAVEYITPTGPAALDGHLFSFTNAPNRYGLPPFYELHVWAWKDNASGAFADMNPDVSCAAVAQ